MCKAICVDQCFVVKSFGKFCLILIFALNNPTLTPSQEKKKQANKLVTFVQLCLSWWCNSTHFFCHLPYESITYQHSEVGWSSVTNDTGLIAYSFSQCGSSSSIFLVGKVVLTCLVCFASGPRYHGSVYHESGTGSPSKIEYHCTISYRTRGFSYKFGILSWRLQHHPKTVTSLIQCTRVVEKQGFKSRRITSSWLCRGSCPAVRRAWRRPCARRSPPPLGRLHLIESLLAFQITSVNLLFKALHLEYK